MTVNVGVIAAGMIGQDHIRRLTYVLSGARVTAVTDVDLDRAKSAVERLSGVQVHETGQDLISDPGVDAIIVASWGPTHEEYVLAGIAAGKQVFCEKPLATTREACERRLLGVHRKHHDHPSGERGYRYFRSHHSHGWKPPMN